MKQFLMIVMCCIAAPAHGALIVSIERIGASVDFPVLTATNTGPFDIVGLSLAIGDTSMNFDYAQLQDASTGLITHLQMPDEENAMLRSDLLQWTFTGFMPMTEFSAKLDIDRDSGAQTVDWQTMLFNNGTTQNAVLTAWWSDGSTNSIELADELNRNPLDPYVVELDMIAVPEPATIILMIIGAIGLVLIKRK